MIAERPHARVRARALRALVIAAVIVLVAAAAAVWRARSGHTLALRERWRTNLHLAPGQVAFALGEHAGRVFVDLSAAPGAEASVVALDTTTGRVAWHSAHSPRQNPVFDGGQVAFATAIDGPTVVADARTGTIVARLTVPSNAGGPCAISNGVVAYVAVRGIGPAANVAGYNLRSGRRRWTRNDTRVTTTCPTADHHQLLMGDGTIDIATGRAHAYPVERNMVAIAASSSTVVECSRSGPAAIEGLDTHTGRRRWQLRAWQCARVYNAVTIGAQHTMAATRGDALRVVDIDSGATLSATTSATFEWRAACATCEDDRDDVAVLRGNALIAQRVDPCRTPVAVLRDNEIVTVPHARSIDAFDRGIVVLRGDPLRDCAPDAFDLLDRHGRLRTHVPFAADAGDHVGERLDGDTLYVFSSTSDFIALHIT